MSESKAEVALREIVNNSGRPVDKAYCLGCHGGGVLHIMVTYLKDDPLTVDAYAPKNARAEVQLLTYVKNLLEARDIETTRVVEDGRVHLRFRRPD